MNNKDKIIELLKTECGLKGQLINMILELEGTNVLLGDNGLIPVLEKYIAEIDAINAEVLKLEEENITTIESKKN